MRGLAKLLKVVHRMSILSALALRSIAGGVVDVLSTSAPNCADQSDSVSCVAADLAGNRVQLEHAAGGGSRGTSGEALDNECEHQHDDEHNRISESRPAIELAHHCGPFIADHHRAGDSLYQSEKNDQGGQENEPVDARDV